MSTLEALFFASIIPLVVWHYLTKKAFDTHYAKGNHDMASRASAVKRWLRYTIGFWVIYWAIKIILKYI